MAHVNLAAMNHHLAEISRCVKPGAPALLIIDGAGWHAEPGLIVPANITVRYLPPYSPELNPFETPWHQLRRRFLANRIFADVEAIIDACCEAWNAAIQDPEFIQSVTGLSWLPPLKA